MPTHGNGAIGVDPKNFRLRGIFLKKGPERYAELCQIANRYPDEPWVEMLTQLASDAVKVVEKMATERKRVNREERYIAKTVGYQVRDRAKLSTKLGKALERELGEYQPSPVFRFDSKKGRLQWQYDHPTDASNTQLVSYALCVAVEDSDWLGFRRCRESKCEKFFYDYKSRGGHPKFYCCKRHGQAHRARVKRGGS